MTDRDYERVRAARIASLAATLEAERKARGLRRWSDWTPAPGRHAA